MDLTADQTTRIKRFIQDWATDPRLELETTFGVGGVVDSTTFLQIAQRLRAKGFQSRAQEDRLNILTPSHIRFTLEGLGVLQAYCKDDTLDNKVFSAMIKDRAFPNSNVDVGEYNVRFKVRREEDLSPEDPRIVAIRKQWKRQRKAFRLIRRWSFEGRGVRMDLSMVRQTVNASPGEYQWSTTFLERNVLQEIPRYEVEVELLRNEYTATPDLALKALISGVGEVLRAIQKNTLLIRNSVAESVRTEYQTLVGGPKFRGVGPVTLETKNMGREILDTTPNLRTGYNVTDKADGVRAMGFVNETGELYLVDQSLNVYRTGLANRACASSLVDGEWVTLTKDQKPIHHFLLFDIYYKAGGEKVSTLPFATFNEDVLDVEAETRYRALTGWFADWSKDTAVVAKSVNDANRLLIALKQFYFAPPGGSIFTSGCASVLDAPRLYHTDGLILTSNDQPLPDGLGVRFEHQFKWKPAKENTVDFLVSFEKETEFPTLDRIQTMEHPTTKEFIQYKTMRLYVGGKKSKEEANPRETILYQRVEEKEKGREKQSHYRPVLFHPVDFPDPMANQCHVAIQTDPETYEEYVMTEDSKEPIQHHSIVEMRYDPRREPGWRWIPSRIRHDKTERLQRAIAAATAAADGGKIKYSGMMNDEGVANSVWNSIHDPVTESMIRSGNENPTEEEWKAMMPPTEEPKNGDEKEEKKYYERKAPRENLALVRGLQDFHNKYIKNELLLKRALVGFNKSVLDVACGKGGDLYKWVSNHARRVLGIDTATDNITNPVDGAYRRYLDVLKEGYFRNPPKMAFAIGNSSKSIVDGSAAATPEDRDILRSIFGRAEPEGPIPPHIQQHFAGAFREGVDVAACMFALHYFFESKATLDGFLDNLAQTVKIGGYFIGCCFDGQKVFQLLQGLRRGEIKTGSEDGVPIWSITKEYEADHLEETEESVGLPIDVNFISIGMTHREYLVPFDYLKERLRAIGFRLLYPEELAQLNLQQSTNTFDQSYRMAQEFEEKGRRAPAGGRFFMPDAVKEFSFLNRWFMFKRGGMTEAEVAPPSASASASVAAAPLEINQRFDVDLTKYNKTYALYSIVDSSQYSVLKPWEKKDVNAAFQRWFQPVDGVRRIVDATAHIGVDAINMSNVFPNAVIDAYEIVPETYQALVKNIIRFKKQQRIRPHPEDVTLWEPTFAVDFLYVDPPWGGRNYAKQDSLDLFLQKEGNEHNETKNVNAFIDKWLASGKIRNIVLKAPKNFNKDYLMSKYAVEEATVSNKQKGVAYTLLRIKASDVVVDTEEVMAEEVVPMEVEIDEKKDDSASRMASFRDPARAFKDKEVFLFGPSVAIRDSLKTKERPAIKLSIKPDHAGRWLSFTAPFPLPDRDATTENGEPILYPTMEHYLAAMKYRHASNRPDLAVSLFSTMGTIHQRFQKQRLEKRTTAGSGTPLDDKLLEEEAKEVRERLTKSFLDKHRIVFNEEKWMRPIHAEDSLSMRDRILRDALAYRWEKDDNFRKILEEVRGQGRYLLYTVGADSEVSEWAGRLEVAGPEKGRIRGENRVGFFLMELAGFS
jgi:SAM-dependent methyltransferase/predicted RNA methylase